MLSVEVGEKIGELTKADKEGQLRIKAELLRLISESPGQAKEVFDELYYCVDQFLNESKGNIAGVTAIANIFHSRCSGFYQLVSGPFKQEFDQKSKELSSLGFPPPF